MLRAFFSHSHEDRKIAAELKEEFSVYGINVFLAHQDLSPTVEWERTLLRHLKESDLFLALLSDQFVESKWTDQETGIAVALKKIIVPMSLGTTPYGFIGRYQAQKVRQPFSETCWNVVRELAKHKKIGREMRVGVIQGFINSRSFARSSTLGSRLSELRPFSEQELMAIVEGSIANDQIYGGWDARSAVMTMIDAQPKAVARKLVREFKKIVSKH